jgi:membrane protein YqaA with SNARE-associated domain
VTHDLAVSLGAYIGTFVACFVAGLVPFVNAEAYLIWLVGFQLRDGAQLPGVVVAASAGMMVAKIILYYVGKGMLELPRGRWKEKLEKARTRIEGWKKKPYLIYAVSSVLGIPPMYLTVLAAGAMKIRFMPFLLIGLAGRIVRFGAIAAIAWYA